MNKEAQQKQITANFKYNNHMALKTAYKSIYIKQKLK